MSNQLLAGVRLLVVEAEFLIATRIAFALAESGATIIGPAHTVDQALVYVSVARIDGVVLDLNLGSKPATPVIDMLMQKGIPYIVTTGHAEGALPDQWKSIPRIHKPFAEADLVRLCVKTFRPSRGGDPAIPTVCS